VEEQTARKVGTLLRTIHESRAHLLPGEVESLRDLKFFRELRIEPFYLHLAERYPQLRIHIEPLVEDLTQKQQCLVHGDFSPKNVLVDPNGNIIILDFEVGHWGNPVFDVAFLTTHLLLKG